MSTKPKAKRFRIRRPASATDSVQASGAPKAVEQTKTSSVAAVAPATAVRADDATQAREQTVDDIRREGLTGRQLRMARRLAQKHGLAPTSDFDAVRLLRANGIDPFERAAILELVTSADETTEESGTAPAVSPERLPQTVATKNTDISTETMSPAERRAREIREIQQDIARRRRRKVAMLFARLAFFVFLPTFIAGYYFYAVATPMYSTKSEFLILKADSAGSAMGGLFSGTQFATNQDAIAVQSYLASKDAMLRLDRDVGFKAHFTQDRIDPIQRLPDNPSNEQAHKLYKRNVVIGYDPTEGVIKMEVTAADPETAAKFSRRLISYAEERVDNLSRRKRENQLADAQRALDDAAEKRRSAQEALVRLQQENHIIDPEGRIASLRTQIGNVESQLLEKELQLNALLDNPRPNKSKVEGVRGDIRRLKEKRDELNRSMTEASEGQTSLAELQARISLAKADLATRDLMLQSALETMEQTRRDALSQARYLTTSVVPVPSQDPSYPRKFENTVLAFLIFSGVYLMLSLTASILREQVSS